MGRTLQDFYWTNVRMVRYHGWSFSDIDEMLPFEREIYVDMTMELEEKESKAGG